LQFRNGRSLFGLQFHPIWGRGLNSCRPGEAPITPYMHAIFCASGNLSRQNKEPEKAVKPYDLNADGMALSEGGACIIIESLEHALNRNADIYGEIISYSALNEAFDLFGINADNGTMALNFTQALERGCIDIRNIDFISAHGNGILFMISTRQKR